MANPNLVDLTGATVGQWTWFDIPGTLCGNGTQTGIAVNKGTDDTLVIFMEGGGACWDQDSCAGTGPIWSKIPMELAANVTNSYGQTEFMKAVTAAASADAGDGSLGGSTAAPFAINRNVANNPYRNATWVSIPYCTGDIHIGNSQQSWNSTTQPTMYYHGAANVTVDVATIVNSWPQPSRVTVMGDSAGAFGATANFWRIANTFNPVAEDGSTPNIRVDMVADSGPIFNQNARGAIPNALGSLIVGSVTNALHPIIKKALDAWNAAGSPALPPDCPECLADLRNIYPYSANHNPSSRIAILSYDADDIIPLFYLDSPYPPCIGPACLPIPDYYHELAELEAKWLAPLPNVKFFVPSNGWHGVVVPSYPMGFCPAELSAPLSRVTTYDNCQHTMLPLQHFATTATTNNYDPSLPHTTKVLGDWLTQMYNDDPAWVSITGQHLATLSSIMLAPNTYNVKTGSTYQFTPTALDQDGARMVPQPTFTWTVSGGGTISTSGLFTASATAGGPYTVTVSGGGLQATAQVTVSANGQTNAVPTVAAAASMVNSRYGKMPQTTAALHVLGADDGGETALKYTWSVVGAPGGAAASFSENGTNAAKDTLVTLSSSGSYTLQVTIADVGGLAATSLVAVNATVNQVPTSIVVTPPGSGVKVGDTETYTAIVNDQFNTPLVNQPSVSWSVTGGGTISSSGVFTATSAGGPYTLAATTGNVSTSVTVSTVTQCTINGVNYAIGAVNPASPCQVCDASTPTEWSVAPDSCLIGGTCYAAGGSDSLGCRQCVPTTSQTSWTNKSSCDNVVIGLTNGKWDGGYLGGLSGADKKCAAEGAKLNLPGTWKAMLGASGVRTYKDTVPTLQASKPVVNLNGEQMYSSWNAIFTNQVWPSGLSMYKFGMPLTPAGTVYSGVVFTGATAAGLEAADCANWTSTGWFNPFWTWAKGKYADLSQRQLVYTGETVCGSDYDNGARKRPLACVLSP